MKRTLRNVAIGVACTVVVTVALQVLMLTEVFTLDDWSREKPLVSPIAVIGVRDGTMTLADGRSLTPAGIQRSDSVSPQDFDRALAVAAAQGVLVTRDLGDGRAFLLGEPKFYNPCGHRKQRYIITWTRAAGVYRQCPVSELLILTGYAVPALDQPGLTERDRWRLQGVEHLGIDDVPRTISDGSRSFRFGVSVFMLADFDQTLELLSDRPPPPE